MSEIQRPPHPPEPGAETVLAMDNIALELPLAGVGSRALAAALDYVVLGFIILSVVIGLISTLAVLEVPGPWIFAAVILTVFALNWGYFAGWEMLTRGRTLGKMAVQLRVVGREGGTASLPALLVRNLLRDVDIVVGLPLIATDRQCRRLGDRVAGTRVIHDRAPEPDVVLGRIPAAWGTREVAVVESYLRRAPGLDPDRSRYLAGRLLQLLARDAPDFAAEVGTYNDAELALRRALRVTETSD